MKNRRGRRPLLRGYAYPAARPWTRDQAAQPWTPPRTATGAPVEWYRADTAARRYPGRPEGWTEGQERRALIGSILDMYRWRYFLGPDMDRAVLEGWSMAKLEYVADQMLFAIADGRAPQRGTSVPL